MCEAEPRAVFLVAMATLTAFFKHPPPPPPPFLPLPSSLLSFTFLSVLILRKSNKAQHPEAALANTFFLTAGFANTSFAHDSTVLKQLLFPRKITLACKESYLQVKTHKD